MGTKELLTTLLSSSEVEVVPDYDTHASRGVLRILVVRERRTIGHVVKVSYEEYSIYEGTPEWELFYEVERELKERNVVVRRVV